MAQAKNKKNLSIGTYQQNQGSYRATVDNGTRRRIPSRIFTEDKHLDVRDRQKMIASTADLYRNCGIITFAVDKHLDYVSTFSFQVKTGNKELNKAIEQKMKWWSKSTNCDVSKRFQFSEMIRLAQKSRLMGGDCLLIKIKGYKLQLIEADQICNPDVAIDVQKFGEIDLKQYEQGLKIDPFTGEVLEYLVCDRGQNGTQRKLLAIIKPKDAIFLAYRPRPSAWRGVSLLAPIINSAKDIMDSQAYNLMKIRLTSLLGFKFTREGSEDLPEGLQNQQGDGTYNLDFTSEKPMVFDLNQGDDVSVIESATPATQTQSYYEVMTLQILRALSIPMSFYKENFSNFYGSKAAAMAYSKSCAPKQEGLIQMLDEITRWLITGWVMDGSIVLPDNFNVSQIKYDWVPAGNGIWKPSEQMLGVGMGVALGQITLAGAAREAGQDYYQNIDEIAKEMAYAKENGVNIVLPNINSNINLSMPNDSVANNTNQGN